MRMGRVLSTKQTLSAFALLILCASFGVSAYFLMPDHGTITPQYSLLTRAVIGDINVSLPTQPSSMIAIDTQSPPVPGVKRLRPLQTSMVNATAQNHVYWLAPRLRTEIEDTVRETLNLGNVPNVVTRSDEAITESNAADVFRSEQEARQRANTRVTVSVTTEDFGDTVELSFAVALERRVWLEPNVHFPVLINSSYGSQAIRVPKKDIQHALFEEVQHIIQDDIVLSYRNSNPNRARG